MLEPALDRLRRPVAGAWPVEVGKEVAARCFSVRPSVRISVNAVGTPLLADAMSCSVKVFPCLRSGLAVGGDHSLVDPPGRLHADVLVKVEQRGQSVLLLVGEQVGPWIAMSPFP